MTMHAHVPLPASENSDPEVIRSILGGDASQFSVLVKRHNQAMFRACKAVLRDDTDAEDAVQAAWVSAFRALRSYRGDASFRTWITRIAVNAASARLRQRGRLAEVELMEVDMEQPGTNPERDACAEALGRMLECEIDALPEGLRTVMVLRQVVELNTAETAACLGIAEEAIRVRLHRARRALAQSMTATTSDFVDRATPDIWRFDGERCARIQARVMAEVESISRDH